MGRGVRKKGLGKEKKDDPDEKKNGRAVPGEMSCKGMVLVRRVRNPDTVIEMLANLTENVFPKIETITNGKFQFSKVLPATRQIGTLWKTKGIKRECKRRLPELPKSLVDILSGCRNEMGDNLALIDNTI